MNTFFIPKVFLLLVTICITPLSLHAQQRAVDWQVESGPPGGLITTIAEDPNSDRIWAVASNRVHYSDDFGEQWFFVQAIDSRRARFAFREDGAIFVGRYRTYDQGQSWEKMALADSLRVRGPYVDPQTGHLIAGADEGFFYSADDGDTWVQSFASRVVHVAANDNGTVFSIAYDDFSNPPKLVVSVDGGVSWDDVSSPFRYADNILVGPDGNLYVNGNGDGSFQVFRSADLGVTWELVYEIASASDDGCLLISLIKITSEGEILSLNNISRFSIDSNTCTTSIEHIPSEFDVNGNIIEDRLSVRMLALGGEERMYAYTSHNLLYRSDDAGATWKKLTMNGITGAGVLALHVDSDSQYQFASNDHGLFVKDEVENEWTNLGFGAEKIRQVLDGPVPESVWMLTEDQILESTDLGQNWSELINLDEITGTEYHDVRSITHDKVQGIHYLLEGLDVYYSNDAGETWHPTNSPHILQTDPTVISMTVSPEGHLLVYARHDESNGLEGIWITEDLGETWNLILEQQFPGRDPHFFYDSTGRLRVYAAEQVGISEDGGMTWDLVSVGAQGVWIYDMIETPDGSFWLGHASGVFRSEDGGKTWQEQFSGNIPWYFDLQWLESESELVFSTSDGHIYRTFIDASLRVGIEDEVPQKIDHFSLSIYPNPVSSTGYIQFVLANDTPVTLDVYDQLGRKVTRLLEEHLGSGGHEIPFQAYGFAPGMYVFRLQTEEGVYTSPFIHVD